MTGAPAQPDAVTAHHGPGTRERNLTLGPVTTAPRCARATVREALTAWGLRHLTEHAEAITSELVTNAITISVQKAPPGTQPRRIALSLTTEPARAELCIRVWDPDPTPPVPVRPGDLDENGRGLIIVAALSQRWGWHPAPNGGKHTWATLPLHSPPRDPDQQGSRQCRP